jgi:hypothetical protein
MVSNGRRHDPYRGFKFRVLPAATLAGLAVFGVVKKLLTTRRKKDRSPAPVEEVSAGSRPIEGVATSTAGFVGNAPKRTRQARPAASRGRRGPRKPSVGAS